MSTGVHGAIIPNRISHYLNWHGPSILVDTACSSSLVALHDAVSALRRGECEAALVGGVSVLCSPTHFVSFSKTGMLSPDGVCRTFDEKANGYVRGKGCGLILLKPLHRARQDRDQILGVVRGTALNHGGRVQTLTSPNSFAQSSVIAAAHEEARISPQSVSYIEAHGTGTPKGDPIEINALKRAFSALAKRHRTSLKEHSCGIGSLKTNIGHLEAASGIAGVIKVLLCIRNKTLPGILHFDKLNPRISFKNSPFYVIEENQDWPALQDAQGRDLPRRAGVSSFGFGGVNAHVVIEEYRAPADVAAGARVDAENPALILLSAKNSERLHEQARELLQVFGQGRYGDADLADIAYTLQVGREAMEERLALIVANVAELRQRLGQFSAGEEGIERLYRGQVKRNKDALSVFAGDDDMARAMANTIDAWIEKGKYAKLLELWVKGLAFDWSRLYGEARPRRVSLPSYPFARERHWVPKSNAETAADADSDMAKRRNRFVPSAPAACREAIAIIGMSGCFPMAQDIHAFWNNLLSERDCISEIPADRWDWREHYGDPAREANKTNVKWGGFIEGLAEFDPLFFGISHKEAELMDPQQRLLMTHVWKAIEDAGYSAASLSGSATAIYVGTADSGYSDMIEKAVYPIEGYSVIGMVPSIGPNRMSYLLNLHGPSEPVETACSSSLVALRKGVLVLESGECGMAIVGGVSTIAGQQGYLVAPPHCVADDFGAFFIKMAPLLKHVLASIATDAEWAEKNPSGNIGVIAHSAGTLGALSLLGSVPDPLKITGGHGPENDGLLNKYPKEFLDEFLAANGEVIDTGISGAILMAPLANVFEPSSLAGIKARIGVYTAGSDAVVNNQDHGNWLRAQIQNAEFKECKNAGHFSFCAPQNVDPSVVAAGKSGFPSIFGGLGELPGKVGFFADPPGFDRAAFHQRLESEVAGFFDFNLA